LFFSFSSEKIDAGSIDHLVELFDIGPTILALAGIDPDKFNAQPKPPQGVSLTPFFTKQWQFLYRKQYAFAQRRSFEKESEGKWGYDPGEKYALQDLQYKIIYRTEGENQLFDVKEDPYESHDLISQIPEKADGMTGLLIQTIARFKQGKAEKTASVNEETLKKLRSLGYID